MLSDFHSVDSATLECSSGEGEVTLSADQLPLGPLIEALVFRRRSLTAATRLKVTYSTEISAAVRQFAPGKVWSYAQAKNFGLLKVQHGEASETDGVEQHKFLLGLLSSASTSGMPKKSAQALTGAAGELIDNIAQHAGGGSNALASFSLSQNSLWIAVGDAGQGIFKTYSNFPEIKSNEDALKAAVIVHRSSTGDPQRGAGFKDLLRALGSFDASIRVRTGTASLECEGPAGSRRWLLREQVQLLGCIVSAHLRW